MRANKKRGQVDNDKTKEKRKNIPDVLLNNSREIQSERKNQGNEKFTVRVEYTRKRSPRLRPLEHKEANLLAINDGDDLDNRLLDLSFLARKEQIINNNLTNEEEDKYIELLYPEFFF